MSEFTYYVNAIPKTKQLGVGPGGTFPQLKRNFNGFETYFRYLTNGPAIGINSLAKMPGKCDKEKSDRQCRNQDRYLWIQDIPSNSSCSGRHLKGLVPGVMNNLFEANPVTMGEGMTGQGIMSRDCAYRTVSVGKAGKTKNIKACVPRNIKKFCSLEFFDNNQKKVTIKKIQLNKRYQLIILLVFILSIILLIRLR